MVYNPPDKHLVQWKICCNGTDKVACYKRRDTKNTEKNTKNFALSALNTR